YSSVHNLRWYEDILTPIDLQLDCIRAQLFSLKRRKRQAGFEMHDGGKPQMSIEREIFNRIRIYEGGRIMEIAKEDKMWDDQCEKKFYEIIHKSLRRILDSEEKALIRGGSRELKERWENKIDGFRRKLLHAKTMDILRSTIAEMLSEGEGFKELGDNIDVVWRLVNDRQGWKKARDLSLLALVTFRDGRLAEKKTEQDV
ncbi:MAG: CRISPR-associated protein Cas8a1/Csx13, partial [Nitrososphaerota archaeon]